tara:strand:+ start:5761 stop:6879 length:1119 start_codon:yes stop_codon:yes gene_type:complete
MDLAGVRYVPILAVSLAEMMALEQLPEKDKDLILPLIPIKGWGVSNKLENSLVRIKGAINDRPWIADIDNEYLQDCRDRVVGFRRGKRDVHTEVLGLSNPENGYQKWYEFLLRIPSAIPCLQLGDLTKLSSQLDLLESLGRGIVARVKLTDFERVLPPLINELSAREEKNQFIILDFESVDRSIMERTAAIRDMLRAIRARLPSVGLSLSGSSFPDSFSKKTYGEEPIYERRFFNSVRREVPGVPLLYSDRGGARAIKNDGGGGIPAPRIDYPLPNDWRFLRREFEDSSSIREGQKEKLYTLIAQEIMTLEYWRDDLRLWGTQVIEFTSKGDEWGIRSPGRATAVRLNIHLHQQLYYDTPDYLGDTDEEWVD